MTMDNQFQANRRQLAELVSGYKGISKQAKNDLGNMIAALCVSAYASGVAEGMCNSSMTPDEWFQFLNQKFTSNCHRDEAKRVINDITYDFHALGGL